MTRWLVFRDWSLRWKMAALIIAASLVPLVVAAFLDIQQARTDLLSHASSLLTARGDQLADRINTFTADYSSAAVKFAHLPRVVDFGKSRSSDFAIWEPQIREVFSAHLSTDPNLWSAGVLDMS